MTARAERMLTGLISDVGSVQRPLHQLCSQSDEAALAACSPITLRETQYTMDRTTIVNLARSSPRTLSTATTYRPWRS